MTEETLATIEGKASKIRKAIEEAALAGGSEPFHDDVYLNIRDDVANTVVASPGNVVLSFCTFTTYFDDIDVEGEKCEAIIEVGEFLTYLDFASDGGKVRVTFRGNPDDRLANVVEITGALNARIMLPASDSILQEVPLSLPDDFNDQNRYVGAGDVPPVLVTTDTDQIERIIEVVDYDPELDYYPVTVKDDELYLDAADEDAPDRNSVSGALSAESVQSPEDFTNHYHEGFTQVFDTLSGKVELQTKNGGAPVVIMQENDGRVLRHMLGPVGE